MAELGRQAQLKKGPEALHPPSASPDGPPIPPPRQRQDIDYVLLRAELDTDPTGIGYALLNDEEAADAINEPGRSNELTVREVIPTRALLEITDLDEYKNIQPESERSLHNVIIIAKEILGTDTHIRDILHSMFTGMGMGGVTDALIDGLFQRDASRAEILDFEPIQFWDIARARAL